MIDCGLFGQRESRKSDGRESRKSDGRESRKSDGRESRKSDGSSSIVASRVRFSTYGSLNKLRSNAPAVFGL